MNPTVDLAPADDLNPTEAATRKRRENYRRWCAANQDKLRGYRRSRQEKEAEAFRQRFDAERERERKRHLQMKAAQLRRSIMRSGEFPETVWWGDIMRDLVRYVADHVSREATDDDRHNARITIERADVDICVVELLRLDGGVA
jgi:hypothetical protein